jgi:membrane-bound lytic murein transglycosylase B
VNPAHLFIGTTSDNAFDMFAKKRRIMFQGEASWMAKLTEAQVKEIRAIYATDRITYAKLGARYGVGRKAISAIIHGKSWSHIL